jgi:hypothetical protein
MKNSFFKGVAFFVGFALTSAFAITVTGLKTWNTGDVVTAADLNGNTQALKTAVESASQIATVVTPSSISAGFAYSPFLVGYTRTVENGSAITRAATVKNASLFIYANSSSSTCTITLRKNSADTAIQFTVPANNTTQITNANTVSVNAGEVLTWKNDCGASNTASIQATVSFEF